MSGDNFLDIDLSESAVPQAKLLEDGTAVEFEIVRADFHVNEEKGSKSLRLMLNVVGEPDCEPIFHYQLISKEGQDEAQAQGTKRRLRDALVAFGYEPGQGVDLDELQGLTATGAIKYEEDMQYGKRNSVKRFS